MKILLVEDYGPNIVVARTLIETMGLECVAVRSGEAAAARAAQGGFALVLMDVEIEGMSGLDAARAIRAAERKAGKPRVPIVAMSGQARPREIAAFSEAGMDGHLPKPFAPDALRAVLGKFLPAPGAAAR